jgi:hypothetical protein
VIGQVMLVLIGSSFLGRENMKERVKFQVELFPKEAMTTFNGEKGWFVGRNFYPCKVAEKIRKTSEIYSTMEAIASDDVRTSMGTSVTTMTSYEDDHSN